MKGGEVLEGLVGLLSPLDIPSQPDAASTQGFRPKYP